MFPQPMSRSEFHPDDSPPDPTQVLERHLLAGFPPDLALDLVLNELVVRAAEATRASAAALALLRGHEMVCRAASGHLAPDLGIPINTRDGLSGACLQTRQPQLSVDTEFDPRVDPVISRRLGIRSILIVPVFDSNNKNSRLTGILEVFSSSPAAFSHQDQKLLEGFAEECARICQAAIDLSSRKPTPAIATEVIPRELIPREAGLPHFQPLDRASSISPAASRFRYEAWALVLGALTILATIAISFLIGSRIGWLSTTSSQAAQAVTRSEEPASPGGQSSTASTAASVRPAALRANPSSPEKASKSEKAKQASPGSDDELVVYENGKVIFRMQPALSKPNAAAHGQAESDNRNPDYGNENTKDDVKRKDVAKQKDDAKQNANSIVEASSTTKITTPSIIQLPAAQAETQLLSRVEPKYPAEARASHRSGKVVLEIEVAENGAVSNIRTISGDPSLAAAATDAVRTWRYRPYRQHDHAARFQTDVTLSFTLPD
jgi:TonB family protein